MQSGIDVGRPWVDGCGAQETDGSWGQMCRPCQHRGVWSQEGARLSGVVSSVRRGRPATDAGETSVCGMRRERLQGTSVQPGSLEQIFEERIILDVRGK